MGNWVRDIIHLNQFYKNDGLSWFRPQQLCNYVHYAFFKTLSFSVNQFGGLHETSTKSSTPESQPQTFSSMQAAKSDMAKTNQGL